MFCSSPSCYRVRRNRFSMLGLAFREPARSFHAAFPANRGYLFVLHGATPGTALAGLLKHKLRRGVLEVDFDRILVWLLLFGWPGSSP